MALPNHQPEGVSFESTAGVHEAEVPALHQAIGEDMLEEPTEKLQSIEARGASTCPTGCAGGEGHGPVRKRDETAAGDCHFADIRGQERAMHSPPSINLSCDTGCVRQDHDSRA